jgi:hypothetical protein
LELAQARVHSSLLFDHDTTSDLQFSVGILILDPFPIDLCDPAKSNADAIFDRDLIYDQELVFPVDSIDGLGSFMASQQSENFGNITEIDPSVLWKGTSSICGPDNAYLNDRSSFFSRAGKQYHASTFPKRLSRAISWKTFLN